MSFHLAGVVPVAGQKLDFNLPWHDALIPISKGYLAVERAIAECAMVGCETIWIVCNDDIKPLIKHVLGDAVQDPVFVQRKNKLQQGKFIPIYYVPIHPDDRGKRDSLGWSAIHGALSARKVCKALSTWVKPNRYYVSFPYGVYPIEFLRGLRKRISTNNPFNVSFNGKTIKDNEYLGFTFGDDELNSLRHSIFLKGTGQEIGNPMEDKRKFLPIEERWSARFFSLDKIFEDVILGDDVRLDREPLWHYNIDSWEKYVYYISSGDCLYMEKPKFLSYKELNPIGRDNV